MKHFMKVSLMALVAMFAFNTVADAQLGGLLKKAKQAVGVKSKDPSQEYYDMLAKEKAEKEATENAAKSKMYEMNNWIAGNKVQASNVFAPITTPISKAKIYEWEGNFRDKAMKKNIIEQFVDDEAFKNKKRTDGMMKDRKVVEIVFKDQDWHIIRNNASVITGRNLEIYVISEIAIGFTICEKYNVYSKYTGSGAYSDTFEFDLTIFPGKFGSRDWCQWMVTDWEHKADANPLAGL